MTLGTLVWIGALAALAALGLAAIRRREPPVGRRGRTRIAGLVARAKPALHLPRLSHAGMPSLRGLAAHIGLAERIPPKLFYLPLALQWLFLALRHRSLSLPTLANPHIEVGGLWGESKRAYLDMVSGDARHWLARYVTLTRGEDADADFRLAMARAQDAGLAFPMVAKPDVGWQGYGVRPVASEEALHTYIAAFPEEATLMLQEMVAWEGEAGVFYLRWPGQDRGTVISLTLRYFPHVTGNGANTVRELILKDERASWKAGLHLGRQDAHGGVPPEVLDRVPDAGETVRLSFIGSIRVGGLYRDADAEITPEMSARFDAISRSMPEFHYGRYDVRFESLERLRAGEAFRIIEINGAGSESISAWDPEKSLGEVYGRLLRHQRLLFEIGARNRARGWKPASPAAVLRAARRQTRLIRRYPPSS